MADDGDGGTDNPAFSHDEETTFKGRLESGVPNGDSHVSAESELGNGGNFVSQHYVEPVRTSPEPVNFTTETRVELPEESVPEKTSIAINGTPKPKQNGVNGKGNNNDVSFLNSTVTSVANNDLNDKKEQIEAVNLELVSMKPYAGANNLQTKNQEACELPTDPYEEYFVPVNEHRKYIRGEKLYVTKDKRSTSSYWRRMFCWGCGFIIIAIAAIIAILAGTGVILTQEATQPLLNGDKTSYRQFNDVQAAGSQEYIKNPPPSPSPISSTFPPWHTTDETLYKLVPKALDGLIKLDDFVWNEDMDNPKSRVYRSVAEDLERSLSNLWTLDHQTPLIKIYSISKEGEVKFTIGKPIFEKPEDNENYLENKFRQNGSAISKYHVNRLKIESLVDKCYSGDMKCSDSCIYDYVEGIFTCICPAGKQLDKNGKHCINDNDLSNINFEETISDDIQGRSRLPDDAYQPDDNGWQDSNYNLYNKHEERPLEFTNKSKLSSKTKTQPELYFEPKSEPEPNAEPNNEPEPSAEPKSEPEPSAEPKSEPEPSSEPKSEPERSAEPKSEPEPSAEPNGEPVPSAEPKRELKSSFDSKSMPELNTEPKREPEPSSEPKSEPEPSAEPKSEPEPSVEPKSEPEPSVEPKREPEASSEPKSEPEPSAELKGETEPSAEPKSEPEPNAEPKSEPKPSIEPKSEPEPSAEPKSEPEPSVEPKREPEAGSEPKSEPEPSAEPKSEPEPSSEPKSEPEPSAEPKSEPEPSAETKSESESSAELKSEIKVSVEATSEPASSVEPNSESELNSEPKIEPTSTVESRNNVKSNINLKNIQEPSAEPKSEPEPNAEPKSEPEPSTEPKSEPEPSAEPKSEPEPSVELKIEQESRAEPKSEPEPSAEPKSKPELASKEKDSELFMAVKKQVKSVDNIIIESKISIESEIKNKPQNKIEKNSIKQNNVFGFTNNEVKNETNTPTTFNDTANLTDEQNISLKSKEETKTEFNFDNKSKTGSKLPIKSDNVNSVTEIKTELENYPYSKSLNEEILKTTTMNPQFSMENKTEHDISTESISEADFSVNPQDRFETTIASDILTTPEIESKTEYQWIKEIENGPELTVKSLIQESLTESNIESHLFSIKNDSTTESRKELEMFTVPPNDPATVIGLTEKHNYEKEMTTEQYVDKNLATEIPLQIHSPKNLKYDTIFEQEYVKNAPRLDKDKKHSLNPFESNVKDVGASNVNNKIIETTTIFEYTESIENVTNNYFTFNLSENNTVSATTNTFTDLNISKDSLKKINYSVIDLSKTRILSPNIKKSKINEQNNRELIANKKGEDNAEDQYNDITDDFVPKGFGRNDVDISQDIKRDEKKIQKTYKQNKKDYTLSKLDIEHINKSSSGSAISTIDGGIDKHLEDPTMTSQIPILPIEIQNDMSTTESMERSVTITSQEPEKETTMATTLFHVDGKTTEEIPILPEELVTTDSSKAEQHTESTLSFQIDKRIDAPWSNDKKAVLENKNTLKSNETFKLNEMNKENEFKVTNMTNQHNTSLESTSNHNIIEDIDALRDDDIKPVSESILDDITPRSMDYKFMLTTTENFVVPHEYEELTEEQLRVVPLEEKDKYMKDKYSKLDNHQVKYKKEKELSFETPNEKIINTPINILKSGELSYTATTESGKIVEDDNIPKLTSETSDSNVNLRNTFKPINTLHANNGSNYINNQNKTDLNASFKKYPNFIPVSEIVDENDNKFIEPSINVPLIKQQVFTTELPEYNVRTEKYYHLEDETEYNSSTTLLLQGVLEATVENSTLIDDSLIGNTSKNLENDKNMDDSATKINKSNTPNSMSSQSIQPKNIQIPVLILNDENTAPQSFFSKCKSGQFQCANGTSRDGAYCVSLSAKCDSENDCSDGSDETNCEKEGCPRNFQCANGQCLKRHLVCNGIVDCDDGTDEKECGKWKCNFDEFQCPNGRCIPVLWQCDGRPDCENHIDEYSCSESCGNDEYLCPIEKWCIPQTWRCNGVSECENGEDEKLCECALDQFKCETGGCIPTEQLCDGVENCPDRSDEWNCLMGFNKNSSISVEADKDSKDNEFLARMNPVKIRQSNGEYRFICSDEWTEAFSDQYCKSLGFASSDSTQFVEQGSNANLLRLVSNTSPNSSLVLNLEKQISCKSGKIVEVSCQEFSCGSHESVGPTARLVGGTPASEGQWSSVALLKEPKYGAACTASVLSPMYALASYSCIYSHRQSNGWQLFVGGNLLKPHKIKNIVPYPQVKYNQFLYNNDIVLVELEEPLIFSRNVSAVCLPSQSFQPRQLCVTAGWGFPVNGEVDLQQYLKFLPVPTYDSEECNATSHYAGFITKNNICAGFTDTDRGPCYNDEGAPLMCVSETGRWEIQGLLSHHSRCSRGHPAIYSSLAPALSWLRNSVPALQIHT